VVAETEFLRRIAEAQERLTEAHERIASVVEKQQPGKISQIVAMGAALVSLFSFVNIVDVIKSWFGG